MRRLIFILFTSLLCACADPQPQQTTTPVVALPAIENATPQITEKHANGNAKKATYLNNSTGAKVADMELYDTGKAYLDRRYTNDTLHGTSYSYYSDGQPWSMNNYNKGVYHGPYQLWWPNGQVRLTGHYINGLEDGEWINFYDNGRIDTRGFYKAGEKADVWTTYNKEGKLLKETKYN
jgi:antitoxin component YwqK of YwqJK toxin-antitoxin module